MESISEEDPTSLVNRRRIKNRLHQRASRARRKSLSRGSSTPAFAQNTKWVIYSNQPFRNGAGGVVHGRTAREIDDDTTQTAAASNGLPGSDGRLDICLANSSGYYERLARLHEILSHNATHRMLRCDLLLSVTQCNIVLAMFSNSVLIGLSPALLDLDIYSPFNSAGPFGEDYPPSLYPTTLQRQQLHHPWVDLLPIPELRNAILQHVNLDDLDSLCGDLFGQCDQRMERTGLLVWGESWDPSAYEMSQPLLRKWACIFAECPKLIESTNEWRTLRGEEVVQFH
ncbi:hypothetical protein PV08_11048 [Exophiala spinifera]|uniref:BZIP domain-containing protein n=1 Tax=Exophiala spinifera TaxID=91928 RepID=A0A0D2ATP1_9EURO|nr:uncharacterized protein PV08_11048 [Exophiala spinifera]KIW10088.1 hypothetical protein PV08_11048 [Exophiala spinifera]